MTGIGPRRGSEPDREPHGQADMDPDALAAAASLYRQSYIDGQESVTRGGYQAGRDLGFDTGYGARNDAGRAFTRGVLEGHEQGMAARHELAEAAARGQAAKTAREAHARIAARQADSQADSQPELEAEAG